MSASFGNNIGLNNQTAMAVPDIQVPDLTLGSKLALVLLHRLMSSLMLTSCSFVNWIWYICLIWCLKGVLLTIFVKLG